MNWSEKGLIFYTNGAKGFNYSHYCKLTPLLVDGSTIRAYFGVRDQLSSIRITFVDLDIHDLKLIKYAFSENSIALARQNVCCIPPMNDYEATARPSMIKRDDTYSMRYCRRGLINFINSKNHYYRAGYAESHKGINWERMALVLMCLLTDGIHWL